MMRALRKLPTALALAAALVASPASADEDAVSELRRQGNDAMQRLNYSEAIELYTKALAVAPNDAALHYNLGRAYQAREDYSAALRSFEAFTRLASPELRAKVQGLDVLVEDLKKRVVTLVVRCSAVVDPVRILLDNRVVATSCSPDGAPVTVNTPRAGASLELKLEAERYAAASRRVAAPSGGTVDVTFDLLPKATSGILRIKTSPAGAEVWIDGVSYGNGGEVALQRGSHTVVAKRDQYEDATVRVVVEAEQTKDLPITLQSSTPVTKKWWFWTALGVVVTGAATVTTVVILNTDKDPTPGSIPPGIIPAPFFRF